MILLKIGDKAIVCGPLPFIEKYNFDKTKSYTIVEIDYYSSYPVILLINNALIYFTVQNIKLIN